MVLGHGREEAQQQLRHGQLWGDEGKSSGDWEGGPEAWGGVGAGLCASRACMAAEEKLEAVAAGEQLQRLAVARGVVDIGVLGVVGGELRRAWVGRGEGAGRRR